MNEQELAQAMMDFLNNAFEAAIDGDVDVPEELSEVRDMRTFDEAGVLTNNAGLVIRMRGGDEYQISIVKSR